MVCVIPSGHGMPFIFAVSISTVVIRSGFELLIFPQECTFHILLKSLNA
jgi:hypothetical protein